MQKFHFSKFFLLAIGLTRDTRFGGFPLGSGHSIGSRFNRLGLLLSSEQVCHQRPNTNTHSAEEWCPGRIT